MRQRLIDAIESAIAPMGRLGLPARDRKCAPARAPRAGRSKIGAIKAAGTLSLLISNPTILVGLDRHRARGAFRGLGDLRHLIVPMGLGALLGGIAGGLLVAAVPADAVKLLLGGVLIASALRVSAVDTDGRR